jgi:hypothetical protein
MADALVDFASLDSAATAVETPVETTEVETTVDSEVETTIPEVDSEVESGKETETLNADGTEKTPEEQEAFKKAATAKAESDKALDSKATPDSVRKTLKALRDADPAKNGEIVKTLHGSYERWNAAKQIFPKGVAEMQEARAFIESVGGPEGYQKTQDAIEAVTATDELLYKADPSLWDNVIADLKANNHPEALGALAPSFLEKLKAHDAQAYYDTFTPHFLKGMQEVGMDKLIANMNAAVNQKNEKGEVVPNIQALTSFLKQATDWYAELEKTAKEKTTAPADTPERKKFLAEKEAFEKTKTESAAADRQKFENGVAEECDKHNNVSLGKALGGFLKMPFFKDFPRETLIDLGNGIKDRMYSELKADKVYQTQMSAMWKQKTPDRAKMIKYHQAKVNSIATDIVTKTVQNRYPGYAKGGSAAGKAAAAVVKKETAAKTSAQSVNTGKPVYVPSRPENLVREPIKVGGKDYSSSDLITLQIAGKGFVRTPDGKSFRLVTWRK